LNSLLTGLKSQDEAMQLQCLIELCDFLSIGTEENMSGFSVDSFAPALVELLNMEHNPDMMLLACRALSYIMEALPTVSSALVGHQAVPALCQKLLNIEYIDLAEQALQVKSE
jgi:E3 ubiquitin-protein ligase TRIP12